MPQFTDAASQLATHHSAHIMATGIAGGHRQPTTSLLLAVHLGVSFPLIRSRKLSAAHLTAEGLLARVGAHMGGQVIRAGEGAHANLALERSKFLQNLSISQPGMASGPCECGCAVSTHPTVKTVCHNFQSGIDGAVPAVAFCCSARTRPPRPNPFAG